MKESNTLSKVKITVLVVRGNNANVNKGVMPSIFLKKLLTKDQEVKSTFCICFASSFRFMMGYRAIL